MTTTDDRMGQLREVVSDATPFTLEASTLDDDLDQVLSVFRQLIERRMQRGAVHLRMEVSFA